MENRCKECYENDKTPDKNDCKKCQKVIIDGVDVSGCKYFQIEANVIYPKSNYCGARSNRFCEDDKNCYYKQLKRLKQENEHLKSQLDFAIQQKDVFEEENTKLKESLETIKDHILDECKRCGKNITSYCELCLINNILSLCDEVLKDE